MEERDGIVVGWRSEKQSLVKHRRVPLSLPLRGKSKSQGRGGWVSHPCAKGPQGWGTWVSFWLVLMGGCGLVHEAGNNGAHFLGGEAALAGARQIASAKIFR